MPGGRVGRMSCMGLHGLHEAAWGRKGECGSLGKGREAQGREEWKTVSQASEDCSSQDFGTGLWQIDPMTVTQASLMILGISWLRCGNQREQQHAVTQGCALNSCFPCWPVPRSGGGR